jgi:hypothetical protein
VKERPLSRWRNLAHPVARRFFVLKDATVGAALRGRPCVKNLIRTHARPRRSAPTIVRLTAMSLADSYDAPFD